MSARTKPAPSRTPHGTRAVARTYGVYRVEDGECERALFVIDADGVIRWSYVSPVGINPGADGILEALESIDGKGDVT